MLDIKLDTFLVLCETRNYTKTAAFLNITQPAVTQHIKSLEKHYQTKLICYDEKRQLQLTKQGELLRDFSQTVKADSARIRTLLKTQTETEEIRLGAISSIGERFAPHFMANFLQKYPDKKISMFLGEADNLLMQLQEGTLHFCISDNYCPPNQFESEVLFESETVCICSPKHPLAGQNVSFKQLNPYRLIYQGSHSFSYQNLLQILHKYNQEPDNFSSYMEAGSINAVKELVTQDVGIAFLYHYAVEEDLKQGRLKQISIHRFSSPFSHLSNSFPCNF